MHLKILTFLVTQFVFVTLPSFSQVRSTFTNSNLITKIKPNIILVLVDDMGYECLSAYGSATYKTPNIDRLATDGVKFSHCYSTPLCSPSRVQIMTGKHNFRNYEAFGYLNPKEKTFGSIFKEAGYSTCIAGKWQLNGNLMEKFPNWQDPKRPYEFGFDDYCLWQVQFPRTANGERYANPLLVHNGETLPRERDAYGPDVFCNFILDFIDRKKAEDKPFFVYYPMVLVHDPFVPTPDADDWSDTTKRYKEDKKYFKDMVAYMDKMVGKIMNKLEQTGLAENTLILITSDNGTSTEIVSTMKDGRSIKGDKGRLTDGGTRVPLIAYWKGKSRQGVTNTDLIDFSDFLPTMMQTAGITVSEDLIIDGRSFLPQILGQKANPKEYLYMYYAPEWQQFESGVFVRNKKYKLYSDGRFYDIEKDVLEQNDLSRGKLSSREQATKNKLQSVLKKMPDIQGGTGRVKLNSNDETLAEYIIQ